MIAAQAPSFWWEKPGWRAGMLRPAAAVYGAVARRRLAAGARAEATLPVLCVGNFTVGGGGKTPTSIALCAAARRAGRRPGFLSRGHGGSQVRPLLVDPAVHAADRVGDEPLLLASRALTVVARDRAAGAELLARGGCDFVIMDDGFQSAHLRFDQALLVVDAGRGIGNGRVLPAGPLRAPLSDQMHHADVLLVVGDGPNGEAMIGLGARWGKPVHHARLRPCERPELRGARALAFSGIADPLKFQRTLEEMGIDVVRRQDFPDHHPFSEEDLSRLIEDADRRGLVLVTTRKDEARLRQGSPAADRLRQRLQGIDVDLVFCPESAADQVIRDTLLAFERRSNA